jgi:hypothetical protein
VLWVFRARKVLAFKVFRALLVFKAFRAFKEH